MSGRAEVASGEPDLAVRVALFLLAAGALFLCGCRGAPSEAIPPPDQRVRLLGIPDEYRGMQNPLPATPPNLQQGEKRYAEYCASCHGADGAGDTPLGHALYPRPGDLRSPSVQAQSDGELFWIVAQGIRYSGMPAGHGQHTEEQMWQFVLHLRARGGRLSR